MVCFIVLFIILWYKVYIDYFRREVELYMNQCIGYLWIKYKQIWKKLLINYCLTHKLQIVIEWIAFLAEDFPKIVVKACIKINSYQFLLDLYKFIVKMFLYRSSKSLMSDWYENLSMSWICASVSGFFLDGSKNLCQRWSLISSFLHSLKAVSNES